ncbi:phosphotransferase family protein [Planotetraspora sp. GP83]|uniref:phosphotransferase family protein n=1 Tax=Planotetraspora sp. GP83 TaxID=3156264 RepID=UPI0035150317
MSGPARAVEAACRGLLGAAPTAVHLLRDSPTATVCRVTIPGRAAPLVVKAWVGRAAWKAHKERLALTALAGATGFGVPWVVAAGPVPGWDAAAVAVTDAGPDTLAGLEAAGHCTRPQVLARLGRLLAAFHAHQPPPPGPMLGPAGVEAMAEDLRAHLPAGAPAQLRRALEGAVALTRHAPVVWCHGDLHPHNVLQPPGGRPQLIDFELSALAPPEWDAAQTLVTADALSPDQQELVLDAYGLPLDMELLGHLVVVHALRGWRWAAFAEGVDTALWEARLRAALSDYLT